MLAAGVLAALLAPPLLAMVPIDSAAMASLRERAAAQAADAATSVARIPSISQRIVEIVPPNPVKAAVDGAMLPLVVFVLLLAAALSRLDDSRRVPVVRFFAGVKDAMLVLVEWVLAVAPIGVFALAFAFAAQVGLAVAGALAGYVAVVIAVFLVYIALLYPVAALLGRVSPRRFAAAVLPAQAVGFSTRSSLAALPANIAGARDRLGLPERATGVALPLAVALLRPNVPISWVICALFLSRLYGVPIDAADVATVVVTSALLSFSVPGLPSASMFMLAPVVAGIGLPVESVGILIAVDAVPDMFKTAANVTTHMTSATVLTAPERAAAAAGASMLPADGQPIDT